jgi:hypothetical protein
MKKITVLVLALFGIGVSLQAQDFNYRGFLDLQAAYSKDSSSFQFAGFDNFLSANITDKLSFTGEIIVQPGEGHSFKIDVERIHVNYEFNNNFKLTAGRFYAPIGYYSTRFYSDHAATMTPSIIRPAILAYEDDGGLLETRPTGIMFTASNLTKLNLTYDLAITNGIGSGAAGEHDSNKAITMRLSASPIEQLKIGAGVRLDQLGAGTLSRATNLPLAESLTTNNFSAFAAYSSDKILLIGEYYSISNHSASTGTVQSSGGFAYLGYTIKKLTPYVQYDYIGISSKDVYYPTVQNDSGIDFGVKYAFNYKSVFKTEYHPDENKVYFQYAVSF